MKSTIFKMKTTYVVNNNSGKKVWKIEIDLIYYSMKQLYIKTIFFTFCTIYWETGDEPRWTFFQGNHGFSY